MLNQKTIIVKLKPFEMNNKTIFNTLFLSLFMSLFSFAQVEPKDPDEILIKGDKLPQVLLVGTFHFAYYGLDAHVTSEENKVNILSPQKQKEVEALVAYIAKFKPTKLVVEGGRNSGYLVNQYRDYKAGEAKLRAREIDQICFRLMDQFGIDTLYGADAPGLNYTMSNSKDSTCLKPFVDELFEDWDFSSDDELSKRYEEFYDYDDRLANEIDLLSYFKYMNDEKNVRRMHGAYLVSDDFKLDEHRGADALAVYWYTRNLRIFRNIQNIETSPDDRILVLFGAGHMSILKQLFESTPEYELIPFGSL